MNDLFTKIYSMFAFSEMLESYNLKIVFLLAVGFSFASILGYFALRLKLSPILGYLLAGFIIGPYSPGFVADKHIAEQLAEIGVVLMMFGVGLDFTLKDLIKVKNIAIPGAIGQTFIAALLATVVVHLLGWSWQIGIILGLTISVASTVVLARILEENRLLKTPEGHIAVGWLIVEDIITVLILLFLPTIARLIKGTEIPFSQLFIDISILAGKFLILAFILLKFGRKVVTYLLTRVTFTSSHELFTISILALVFVIAISTTFFFGISIALGAFLAGMVIKQTRVHHKVLVHSLAMKDAFIAIFFLSVGMIFDPSIIYKSFSIFISILLIILIAKPLIAIAIAKLLKYPFHIALLVAVALAQIGEFSFILSEEALKYGIMQDEGYDIVVACALISIAINPLIFKFLKKKRLNTTSSL